MQKYISYNKLSKKEKKRINSEKRIMWSDYGLGSPVTRSVENKKRKSQLKRHNYIRDYLG